MANVFMVELEIVLVPELNDHVKKWRFFVNDTFVYIKCGSIEYVLSALNLFHERNIIIDCFFSMFYLLGIMRK